MRAETIRRPTSPDRGINACDLSIAVPGWSLEEAAGGAQWVLGANVCRGSWAGIVWDGIIIKGLFASIIAELVDAANVVGFVEVVSIGIPIGLPGVGPRRADVEALAFVGPLGRCCWVNRSGCPQRPRNPTVEHLASPSTDVPPRVHGPDASPPPTGSVSRDPTPTPARPPGTPETRRRGPEERQGRPPSPQAHWGVDLAGLG